MRLVNTYKLMVVLVFFTLKGEQIWAQPWSLQQCIDTAQIHNKSLQIGKNNVSIGTQKSKEASANLLPKLSVNADYKYFVSLPFQLLPLSALNPTAPEGVFREAQFGVPHNINANVQLNVPIYNPQLVGAVKTTQEALRMTELQFQRTEEQVVYEIANLYYNAQLVYQQMVFLDSNMMNTARLFKNMQLLHNQLLVKGTDVMKVELQAQQLATQRANVQNKHAQLMNALKIAVGLPLEANLEIESAVQMPSKSPYSSLSTLEFKMAQVQHRILRSELSTLNRSKYFPSVHFMAMYGTTGFGYDGQPTSFLNFYPIGFTGLQIAYPLFNGTVTQRKMNQKSLELKNTELQMDLINERTAVQVENATFQKAVAQQTAENATAQIKLAQLLYEQTVAQQQQGVANLTDVLLADHALREAQQSFLAATIEYLKADLELKKATGNLTNKY